MLDESFPPENDDGKKKSVRQINLQNAAHSKKPHKHAEPITERW